MKTSKVFKIAKKYLNDGSRYDARPMYICYALGRAEQAGLINFVDLERTEKIISDLLGYNIGSLGIWLATHHRIKYWQDIRGHRKLQQTRHAWLDHLIKHYQSLGD